MASSEHLLSHQDLVKAVIIHQNIHEGLWRLNINFNVAATHGKAVPNPCVAVTIEGIGIRKAEPGDEMAVDAALANPKKIVAPPDTAETATRMQFCRDVYRNVDIHLDEAAKPVTLATAVDLRVSRSKSPKR
ncbi:hypothetical protein [Paraburkholderia sp.]|jgi:hypothetical protein|uniref:hypothetical protein n=1 Tax=Paraburkholderia sp. TaxID=1926495 RepID=UPI002F42E491